MSYKFFRRFTSFILALVITFAGYSPALAAPPVNDNFIDAISITLPFSITVDITEASVEADESTSCGYNSGTVWYMFTPAESMTVKMDIQGSAIAALVGVYRAESPGITGLYNQQCADIYSYPVSNIAMEGGFTYYFQVGSISAAVGNVQVNLERIPPPANDNFANAEIINSLSLPFSTSLDSTGASREPNEPYYCYGTRFTVWYSFTALADGVIRADMAGSSFGDTEISVFEAIGPGFSGLSFVNCGNFGTPVTFNVQAGAIYYLQAGSTSGSGGDLHFNLQEVASPTNDDFINATIIPPALPFDDTVETAAATIETDEPTPTCGYYGLAGTVWYAFNPTTSNSVSVQTTATFNKLIGVYSGNSLAGLTEVGCSAFYGGPLSFYANAGTTYYIQASAMFPEQGQGGILQIHMDVAPPPIAGIYYYPFNPSAFDTIQFFDQSYDPGQLGFQSFTWDFGDGTTSTNASESHTYAADGDYTVEHSVTTSDGRTASTSQVVQVRTHDVSLTKVESPGSARVGKSEKITVSVLNTSAYTETVRVDLYRSVAGGGFEYVGTLTKNSASNPKGDKPTKFTFNYTFVAGDAAIGKVIFRAVVTIENAPDAFPQDNESLSSLTMVKQKK